MDGTIYESVSLTCSAHGFGSIKIVWKRIKLNMPVTAMVVTEKKSLNSISSVLKITKIFGYYSGQYYCVAESEAGKVLSQIANLLVQGSNVLVHVL